MQEEVDDEDTGSGGVEATESKVHNENKEQETGNEEEPKQLELPKA